MKLTYIKDAQSTKPADSIELLHINQEKEYDIPIRIIAILFDKYLKKFNLEDKQKSNEYNEKKKIINQFEKVMSCIRFEIIDTKEIFKTNKDNLSVLMDISASVNFVSEFETLLDNYLDIMEFSMLNVQIKDNSTNQEIEIPEFINNIFKDIKR